MNKKELVRILVENDLKVTPQRIAILEVILSLDDHPSAEDIISYIRINQPNLTMATVYNNLSAFTRKGIAKKVHSDSDVVRYDAIHEKHHHLYCTETDRIADYYDEELDSILAEYFKKKTIPDFSASDFKLQITGRFKPVKEDDQKSPAR